MNLGLPLKKVLAALKSTQKKKRRLASSAVSPGFRAFLRWDGLMGRAHVR